jgi:RNA polymerase sigma factor (sigma-70 family)
MATVERATDAELLLRLRARDRDAWEELYTEFQPRLRTFAYRLAGNVHDADDLVQETFVRAVPRLERLDPGSVDLGAYLFTTCKNLFYKQTARAGRAEPVAEVPEPAVPAPIEDDPERSTLLRSQQHDVRIANARLDSRQRLVLALRELEDRSYAEIGEIVGLKENAVAQLIFRARESLRVEIRLAQVDPERLPETCRRFLPLLAKHLDGELKEPRLAETLAHLDECERCQSALADMREASRRYRALVLPAGFQADECKAAIDDHLERSGFWTQGTGRRRLGPRSRLAAIGVAALALGAGGTALGVALADGEPTATTLATPAPKAPTTAPSTPEPTTRFENRPPPRSPGAPPGATDETPATTEPSQTETATASTPTTTATKPKPTTPTGPASTPTPTVTSPPPPPPPPTTAPDTVAPTVTITSGPSAVTSTDSVDVVFGADEPGVTFSCSTDGANPVPCRSPVSLTKLASGLHRFSVLGTDPAGNSSPWVTVTWRFVPPDTTPPTATITSGPTGTMSSTSATFAFVANEAPATFECSLDGAAFSSCVSPAAYVQLALGAHSFAVRAKDAAGNVGASATAKWTVALPDLVISRFGAFSITVTNAGTAASAVNVLTITLVGTFTVPALAPGASVTFNWSTCRTGTYTAIVDRTNLVAESNEKNNTAARTSTCQVP